MMRRGREEVCAFHEEGAGAGFYTGRRCREFWCNLTRTRGPELMSRCEQGYGPALEPDELHEREERHVLVTRRRAEHERLASELRALCWSFSATRSRMARAMFILNSPLL